MATAPADRVDQIGAQFLGDRGQFGFIEAAQVGGCGDAGEARITRGIDHPYIFAPAAVTGKETRVQARTIYRAVGRTNLPVSVVQSGPGAVLARIRRGR